MATNRLNGKATASQRSNNTLDHIDYSKISLRGKHVILFVWQDELEPVEITNSFGLILHNNLSKDKPRWGKVVKTTPDSGVEVGEWILPEKTVEPFGCVIGEVEHWRTTSDKVLLVTGDLSVAKSIQDSK